MRMLPAHFDARMKPPLGTPLNSDWVKRTGCVLYLPMSEAGGNLVNDLSGNQNNGTITGAAWIAGHFGSAITTNGSTSYVKVPFRGLVQGAPFTVEFWACTDASVGWKGIFALVTSAPLMVLYFNDDYNGMIGRLYTSGENGPSCQLSTAIDETLWHHYVCVSYGTTWTIYVDGIDRGQSGEAPLTANTDTYQFAFGYAHPSFFGALTVEKASIFNRALTTGEVARLYMQPFEGFQRSRIELWTRALGPAGGGTGYEEPVAAAAALTAGATDSAGWSEPVTAAAGASSAATDVRVLVDGVSAGAAASSAAADTAGWAEPVDALAAASAAATELAAFLEAVAAAGELTASATDVLNNQAFLEPVEATAALTASAADLVSGLELVAAALAAAAAAGDEAAFGDEVDADLIGAAAHAESFTGVVGGVTKTDWANYQRLSAGRVIESTYRPRQRFTYDRRAP
jgi:hypothetical protein